MPSERTERKNEGVAPKRDALWVGDELDKMAEEIEGVASQRPVLTVEDFIKRYAPGKHSTEVSWMERDLKALVEQRLSRGAEPTAPAGGVRAHPLMEQAIRDVAEIIAGDSEAAHDVIAAHILPALEAEIAQAVAGAYRVAADLAEAQAESFAETIRNTKGSEESTQILKAHFAEAAGLSHMIRKLTPASVSRERQRERLQARVDALTEAHYELCGCEMPCEHYHDFDRILKDAKAALAALDAPTEGK